MFVIVMKDKSLGPLLVAKYCLRCLNKLARRTLGDKEEKSLIEARNALLINNICNISWSRIDWVTNYML